jgi:hypothetical protein
VDTTVNQFNTTLAVQAISRGIVTSAARQTPTTHPKFVVRVRGFDCGKRESGAAAFRTIWAFVEVTVLSFLGYLGDLRFGTSLCSFASSILLRETVYAKGVPDGFGNNLWYTKANKIKAFCGNGGVESDFSRAGHARAGSTSFAGRFVRAYFLVGGGLECP